MNKGIIYYPFPFRELTSGSSVRPVKILEAFKLYAEENNIELIVIYGSQKERERKLDSLYKKENPGNILFCYIENVNIPIWLSDKDHIPKRPFIDLNFLKFLKKNSIPTGIFYRDIYWKFEHLFKMKKGIKQIMGFLFKLELDMFKKYSDIIFLPSLYMNDYVSADKVMALPPGGQNSIENENTKEVKIPTAFYVGGISPRYGVYDMLEAFKLLNEHSLQMELIFVCREKEAEVYSHLLSPYIQYKWLNMHHVHGEELQQLYPKADFGIVPIKKEEYNDFAVSVKLFEYMSHGLPILSTNSKAHKDIIDQNNIGLVVEDNSVAIKEGLEKMLDPEIRKMYKENTKEKLLSKHLWYHRAETVVKSLVHNNLK